eukprot:gene5310-7082_t
MAIIIVIIDGRKFSCVYGNRTREGRKYFFNADTQQSVWDNPPCSSSAPSASFAIKSNSAISKGRISSTQHGVKFQQKPTEQQLSFQKSSTSFKKNAEKKGSSNLFANDDDDDDDEFGHRKRALITTQMLDTTSNKGSSAMHTDTKNSHVSDDEDEEIDPLDAFMAGIDDQVAKEKLTEGQEKSKPKRDDIEELDDHESFFQMVDAKIIENDDQDEETFEYDEDGNVISQRKAFKKDVDPLGDIDHTEIDYPPFNRNFFEEHEDVAKLAPSEVVQLRKQLGLEVTGKNVPKPCVSFAYFGFDSIMMQLIQRQEYVRPTAIQAQAVPVAMSGRDIIGIAETGSGKTAAFVWPAIRHVLDQPEIAEGDGPIAVFLAPTRELCLQITSHAKRYTKHYNLIVTTIYGGGNRYEQVKALKEGCEIIVATPGRLIDLIKDKATNLRRVTYLVLDEADRMFDMGFSQQVTSIINHTRPDRQTLLFTATFKKKVEWLARQALADPIRIVVGTVGMANADIEQHVEIMHDLKSKWAWLRSKLPEMQSAGNVLVFVNKKADAELLHESIKVAGFEALLIHGDIDQTTRQEVISMFKRQTVRLLVATDVAARGLDIPAVKTVVNFDAAKNIDTHTHRIGRTGRAGVKGTAWTLLMRSETAFAAQLVESLEAVKQEVSDTLLYVAEKDPKFAQRREQRQKGHADRGRGRAQSFTSSGDPLPPAGRGKGSTFSDSNKRRSGLGFGSTPNQAKASSNLGLEGLSKADAKRKVSDYLCL